MLGIIEGILVNKTDNNSWSLETKHGAYTLEGEFELAYLRTFQTNILFYRSYSMICRSSGDFSRVL